MDGYETFPRIRKNYPVTRIVLLTQHSGEALIQHFIKLKVNAILLKRNTNELAQAIRAVWNTGHCISDEVRESLEHTYHAWEASLPLARRARELIKRIADGKSSKEIASLMSLGENTINSYRQDMLRQTHTKNTDELIAFAFTNGLVIESLPQ
jgi:DNA-binding NarL/FixJ family response regulator